MKRFLLICLVLATLTVEAQAATVTIGTATGTTTAAQDQTVVGRRNQHNADLCRSKGLVASCTQANLDAACFLPSPPAAPGTLAPAGSCGTIYATTAAGAQQYALDRFLGNAFLTGAFFPVLDRETVKINQSDAVAAYLAGTTAAADALCTASGITPPCTKQEAACGALGRDRFCKP